MIQFTAPASYLTLAVLAAVSWGFWAFFTKLAVRTAEPATVLVISYLTAGAIGATFVLTQDAPLIPDGRGLLFALAAGATTGLGAVFYYTSLRSGGVGAVSTIVGLYFVVATILGIVFLHETPTAEVATGILFAVLAIYFLTR